jgi:hypothetical protein
LLGVGGLAATSALGFFYLKDRHGVVLLPLLSYILFLSIDRIFRGTICDTRGFLLRALILSAAVSTSVRVGGTIAAERELAVDQKASWILMLEDLEGKWSSSPDKIEVVRRYARFADSRRLATTAYDPPWIKEWLGGKASINR